MLVMAFFRAVSINILSTGLPNYVIYDMGRSSFLAGLTNTSYCGVYAAFTFLTGHLSDKIGRKTMLNIGVIGCNLVFIGYLFNLPIELLIAARALEGLFTAFIWPAMMATLSDVQEIDDNGEDRLSKYNFSWNAGTIIGSAAGALAVFWFSNNSIIFYIGYMGIILLIPFLIWLKLPTKAELDAIKKETESAKKEIMHDTDPIADEITISAKNNGRRIGLSAIPLWIPAITITINTLTFGGIFLIASTKFEAQGIPSYLVYVLSFSRTAAATAFAHLAVKRTSLNFKKYTLLGGLLIGFSSVIYAFLLNLPVYVLLAVLMGVGGIITYTSSFKIVADKNAAKSTGKYAGYFEGIIGIGSGISPFILGYIADYNYNAAFLTIGVFGIISSLIIFVYIRKNDT